MDRIAVILFNMGGPNSLEAVEPFLFNLFRDPDIFKIPWGQKYFAKIISKLRSPKVIKQYKKIGGKSPQNYYTEQQRKLLEISLRKANYDADVFVAMRYWHPLTEEIVLKISKTNYDKIILLPLYPQYSSVTTGSSLNEWKKYCKADKEKTITVKEFHNCSLYISALNKQIDKTIEKFFKNKGHKTELLFSAHGVPKSLITGGDPYQLQILETVRSIMNNRNENYHISYQSKVGPVKWLEPSTEDKIIELGKSGVKNLLVIPVSFVSDHIETLYELGFEYKKLAEENNISNYVVMEGLNDSPDFISALHKLVVKELKNE